MPKMKTVPNHLNVNTLVYAHSDSITIRKGVVAKNLTSVMRRKHVKDLGIVLLLMVGVRPQKTNIALRFNIVLKEGIALPSMGIVRLKKTKTASSPKTARSMGIVLLSMGVVKL